MTQNVTCDDRPYSYTGTHIRPGIAGRNAILWMRRIRAAPPPALVPASSIFSERKPTLPSNFTTTPIITNCQQSRDHALPSCSCEGKIPTILFPPPVYAR